MITKARKSEVPPPPEFWGKVKGMVRHIEARDKYAVYAIEESPGYREIRFKKRRYRIFFPWLYFFVKVLKTCETDGNKLAVLVAKRQVKDINEKSLLYAPFPSSEGEGLICMPDSRNKTQRPIDTALDVICEFWKSNSNELGEDGRDLVPEQLTKGKDVNVAKLGAVYGAWSKMDPSQAMNMEFDKPEPSTSTILWRTKNSF